MDAKKAEKISKALADPNRLTILKRNQKEQTMSVLCGPE